MESLKKIQTKTYIVDAIKREILSGNIKAGEELVQEEIAQMLQVSRMPVREALQLLEQEGFIIRMPNRHMKAAEIGREQIISVFRVLEKVEYQIICELLEQKPDMSEIQVLAEEYLQSNQMTTIEEEINFHKKISEILQNEYLEKIHHSMLKGYYAYAREKAGNREEELYIQMRRFIKQLLKKNKKGVQQTLHDYFEVLAEILITYREGVSHE